MFRLIVSLTVLTVTSALSDVDRACIAQNNATVSNDIILGSWFKVYEFTLFGGLVDSTYCAEVKLTKPTAEELQEYRNNYNSPDLPYSFEDNPLIFDEGWLEGLLIGNAETKFFIIKPGSGMIISHGYEVNVYRPINDRFMLFWKCSLRGNTRWLLSRDRNASVQEMQEVIQSRPELATLRPRRYCA